MNLLKKVLNSKEKKMRKKKRKKQQPLSSYTASPHYSIHRWSNLRQWLGVLVFWRRQWRQWRFQMLKENWPSMVIVSGGCFAPVARGLPWWRCGGSDEGRWRGEKNLFYLRRALCLTVCAVCSSRRRRRPQKCSQSILANLSNFFW